MDSNKIKKGLGRGLSSLIGENKTEININKLSISDLVSNKYQPRKIFDEENLQDLTNSIKERGIIQPIIVRKSKEKISKYEIIAGERRWLAAQKAGMHEVPVVITEVDDLKSLEFAMEKMDTRRGIPFVVGTILFLIIMSNVLEFLAQGTFTFHLVGDVLYPVFWFKVICYLQGIYSFSQTDKSKKSEMSTGNINENKPE